MFKRISIIVVAFALAIWALNFLLSPSRTPSTDLNAENRQLFSKDLNKRLEKGQLVVVDDTKSDKYIQEDMSTYDLSKALAFARYKSEVLGKPLYIESKKTFKTDNHVAKVTPRDRRAWQELTLLEVDLKNAYELAHPNDTEGYATEKALDPKRTPEAMLKFIDRYADTNVVATALAHIEYCYCVAQDNAAKAIETYDMLEKKYSDKPFLVSLLPEYRQRAMDFRANKLKG